MRCFNHPSLTLSLYLALISSNYHTYKVLDLNYDACVERARHLALEHGGLYIQERAYF